MPAISPKFVFFENNKKIPIPIKKGIILSKAGIKLRALSGKKINLQTIAVVIASAIDCMVLEARDSFSIFLE